MSDDDNLVLNSSVQGTQFKPMTSWQQKLKYKGVHCEKAYKKHILDFRKVCGTTEYFCQGDIDGYLHHLNQDDERRPREKKRSKSTKI